MPLHWTISHSARLVVAVAKGEVHETEAHRYFADLLAQRTLPYRKLFELKQSMGMLDSVMLKGFVATVVDSRGASLGPIAIVVDDDDAFAKAERFSAGAVAERPLRIFRQAHEARRWLDTFVT